MKSGCVWELRQVFAYKQPRGDFNHGWTRMNTDAETAFSRIARIFTNKDIAGFRGI
jgi:hypothetical protein